MLYYINKLLPPRQWRIPLAGLVLTLGVVSEYAKPVLSNQINKVQTSTLLVTDIQSRNALQPRLSQANTIISQKKSSSSSTAKPTTTALIPEPQAAKTNAELPSVQFPKQDGIYLYGQSPKPNQIGQGYIVFVKQKNLVTGALYMPNSEFSCFQGNIDSRGELAMTVTAPGSEGVEPVATANRLPKLDIDEPMSYAYSVALQDYHQLNSISASDRQILQMCNQSDGVYRKLVK